MRGKKPQRIMSPQNQSASVTLLKKDRSATVVSVACLVLLDSEGAVLIARRPLDKSLGGLWEFPGGKVEAGESAEVALRRELREELQLEVGSLQAMEPVVHTYEFGTIRLLPFLAQCQERPKVQLMEHSDFRWAACDALTSFEWAPADLPVVAALRLILDGAEAQTAHRR